MIVNVTGLKGAFHNLTRGRYDAAAKAALENRGAKPPKLTITATMVEIYNEEIKAGIFSKFVDCTKQ